jgi:hypothetical protein
MRAGVRLLLDDDVTRGATATDPMGFVADLPPRVILDETKFSTCRTFSGR